MIEIHEEVVVVDVDSQLEGFGQLVVAEEMVEEFAGQIMDLFRIFIEDLNAEEKRRRN